MASKEKTVKYFFGVSSYNTPFTAIPISKNEYNSLVKRYSDLVVQNNKDYPEDNIENSEYRLEISERTVENDTTAKYIIDICDGATFFTLYKLECKPGYKFRK